MKKLSLFIIIALLFSCIMTSCAGGGVALDTNTSEPTTATSAASDIVTEPQDSDTAAETLELHEDLVRLFEEDENTYEDFTTADAETCAVHHPSFHVIPGEAIYYVIEEKGYSEDDVYEWLESFSDGKDDSATECHDALNMIVFAEKFGITKDEMYDMHFLVSHPEIDIEVLYSGDETKIEEYFTDFDEFYKIAIKKAHYEYVKEEAYKGYRLTLERYGLSAEEFYRLSFPEMAWFLGMNRNPQSLAIHRAEERCIEEFGECYVYDFKTEYTFLLRHSSHIIEHFSSNELDEMFCGLGRYKNVTIDFGEEPEDNYSCGTHSWMYHVLPPELIEYVGGREALEAKFDLTTAVEVSSEGEKQCSMLNIKDVIDAFGISKDEFAEVCPMVYYSGFDLEVLFDGTAEDAEEYYTDDVLAFSFGVKIESFLNIADMMEELAEGKDIQSLSIPEVVKLLEISRDDLERMIEESIRYSSYDYNLDMLYGEDGEIIFENTEGMSSNELNEMFCRVGRYAEKIVNE